MTTSYELQPTMVIPPTSNLLCTFWLADSASSVSVMDNMEEHPFTDPVAVVEELIEQETALLHDVEDARVDGRDPDTEWLLSSAVAIRFFSPGSDGQRADCERNNGAEWYRRLCRPGFFLRRVRMSEDSCESLYSLVKPFMRYRGDGRVGHPLNILARIRLLLVLYWLAQGGSLLLMCDTADVSESTFNRMLREVLFANESALPRPCFPATFEEQSEVATEFASLLACLLWCVSQK